MLLVWCGGLCFYLVFGGVVAGGVCMVPVCDSMASNFTRERMLC